MSDISPLAGLSSAQNKNAQSGAKLAKDLDSFLLLLTSQLKNQDPLSPMDSTEFTNQLTQFAQVEQQININANLTSLLAAQTQTIVSGAVNYIGNIVEGQSDQVPMQDGKFRAAYGLVEEAKVVTVIIKNQDGDIVHSITGETAKGVHELAWNGKDQTGQTLPDGSYTVSVTALSGDGKPVDSYVTAFGRVTGVTTIDNQTVLLMDKVGVPIDRVLSVSEQKAETPAEEEPETPTT